MLVQIIFTLLNPRYAEEETHPHLLINLGVHAEPNLNKFDPGCSELPVVGHT